MKRFTETTKWTDPWFRKLDPKFKALWLYLVDSCDVAGVWNTDLELAEFHIGAPMNLEEIKVHFSERIQILDNGKWYLTKFIEYQYGQLNPENNCHKAVLRSLEINKIRAPKEPLKSPLLGAQDKEKDKVRKEGECEGKQLPPSLDTDEFREAWGRWIKHRRELKKKLTPSMIEASQKRLADLGSARAIEVIDYTIAKGWQGLADEAQVVAVSPAKSVASKPSEMTQKVALAKRFIANPVNMLDSDQDDCRTFLKTLTDDAIEIYFTPYEREIIYQGAE